MFEEKNLQLAGDQLNFLDGFPGATPTRKQEGKESILKSKCQPSNSLVKGDAFSVPEKLLIIDTETTGLDLAKDHCLEVGAILFHVKSRSVLAQQSFLIPVESNAAVSINKIPAEITRVHQPWLDALAYFMKLIESVDALVAHNVAFDKKWFGKEPLPNINKPWICSMEDIPWPVDRNLRIRPSVRDLALAYEIPVWSAHRALTDCIYLAEVFKRCNDLEDLLIKALEPKKLVRAIVSYDERGLAKKAGFRWNEPIQGAWTRRLSDRQISELEFKVVVIDPVNIEN